MNVQCKSEPRWPCRRVFLARARYQPSG
jgi:hypothetical protein